MRKGLACTCKTRSLQWRDGYSYFAEGVFLAGHKGSRTEHKDSRGETAIKQVERLLIFRDHFSVFNLQIGDVRRQLQLFAILRRLHHFPDSRFQRGLRDR